MAGLSQTWRARFTITLLFLATVIVFAQRPWFVLLLVPLGCAIVMLAFRQCGTDVRGILDALSLFAGVTFVVYGCIASYWWASHDIAAVLRVGVIDSLGTPVASVRCEVIDIPNNVLVAAGITDQEGVCVLSGTMRARREVSLTYSEDRIVPNRYRVVLHGLGRSVSANAISPRLSNSWERSQKDRHNRLHLREEKDRHNR
jgi:hypothetical protein